MKIINVQTKIDQNRYLTFLKNVYKENKYYVDQDSYIIKHIFNGNSSFLHDKIVEPILIEDENEIIAEAIFIYAKKLPQYYQIAFFEAKENRLDAVDFLVNEAVSRAKRYNCSKLVVGLKGHVNYGLGLLDSHFNYRPSFGSIYSHEYYRGYFKSLNFESVYLNSYKWDTDNGKIDNFSRIISKLEKSYDIIDFDKKRFKYFSNLYTDFNNECFKNHKYYYERTYDEDYELLRELFLFIKPENLFYAFIDGVPAGFILWYKDYNQVLKQGQAFNITTLIKLKLFEKSIKRGKVVEMAIREEYRKTGLVYLLLNEAIKRMRKHELYNGESSWILEENIDSNSVTSSVTDETYKRYVVYEKDI